MMDDTVRYIDRSKSVPRECIEPFLREERLYYFTDSVSETDNMVSQVTTLANVFAHAAEQRFSHIEIVTDGLCEQDISIPNGMRVDFLLVGPGRDEGLEIVADLFPEASARVIALEAIAPFDLTPLNHNTPHMKFECEDCGPIEYIEVDGYHVGDRLLEDVMFRVIPDGEHPVIAGKPVNRVEVEPDAVPYFSELNEQLWLRRVLEYAEEGGGHCPKCKVVFE
jgi:hypothetical protein